MACHGHRLAILHTVSIKVRAYEGGTSTPLIISWPDKYAKYNGEIRHNRAFLPDIMATFIDAAETTYPKTYHGGNEIIPLKAQACYRY